MYYINKLAIWLNLVTKGILITTKTLDQSNQLISLYEEKGIEVLNTVRNAQTAAIMSYKHKWCCCFIQNSLA